jgi:mRNA-degrading endonuclease RelE of RelBE toxin-antitoxin system
MDVKFEEAATVSLDNIMLNDRDVGFKILARLKKLKVDPFPHSFGDVTVDSHTVQFLKDLGMDIRRLKCSEFNDYRIFYFVNEETDMVIVCEIIKRNRDTYSEIAPHMERIKSAYRRHFTKLRESEN